MKQYIVDAFTDRLFGGNQAAVMVLDHWLSDELMQSIAIENNFSETAFTVKEQDGYHLRWFTPGGEVDFCGHATLGAAYTVFRFCEPNLEELVFHTRYKGDFIITRQGELFTMDLPAYGLPPVAVTPQMEEAVGAHVLEAYLDRDLLLVLESEDAVRRLTPDLEKVKALDGTCLAVTAKGEKFDCVSRVFVPKLAVPEDPVTGSSHCMIVPYWANRLGKEEIHAFQASKRGGELFARLAGDRVLLSGSAVLFAEAEVSEIGLSKEFSFRKGHDKPEPEHAERQGLK